MRRVQLAADVSAQPEAKPVRALDDIDAKSIALKIAKVIRHDFGFTSDEYQFLMSDSVSKDVCFAAIKLLPLELRIPTLNACLIESNVWFGSKFAFDVELEALIRHAYKNDCDQLKDIDAMTVASAATHLQAVSLYDHSAENPYYHFATGLFYLNNNQVSRYGIGYLKSAVLLNPNPIYQHAFYKSLGKLLETAASDDASEEQVLARGQIMSSNYSPADWFEGIKTLPAALVAKLIHACLQDKDCWLAAKFAGNKELLQRMQEYLQSNERPDAALINKGGRLMKGRQYELAAQAYMSALAILPSFAGHYNLTLARVSLAAAQPQQSQVLCEQALKEIGQAMAHAENDNDLYGALCLQGVIKLSLAVLAHRNDPCIKTYEGIGEAVVSLDKVLSAHPELYSDFRIKMIMCNPFFGKLSSKVLLDGMHALPVNTQQQLLKKCQDKKTWLGRFFDDGDHEAGIRNRRIAAAALNQSGIFSPGKVLPSKVVVVSSFKFDL